MKKLYILWVFLAFFSCKGDFAGPSGVSSEGGPQTGRGGSLARFTIIGDHLYTVNGNDLKTFSLANNGLKLTSAIEINAFAETIFPFKNHLFLGTRTGMMIYGLVDASKPNYISQYSHIASCDPVVAQGNFAYVTLRNGTPCMRGQNQLDVLDISILQSPLLTNSVVMTSPQGLSAADDRLYVCEGENGLSVFNIADPARPSFLVKKMDIKAFDIIGLGEHLIMTGSNGISQYSVDNQDEFQHLSTISLGQ